MNIQSISQKIFRTDGISRNNQTNPFGVTFKGNIISADVFDKKDSDLNETRNKRRIFESALVGSITSFNSAVGRRLNSVVSFGRRIKETTNNLWAQANNVNMKDFLSARMQMPSFSGEYNVKNLAKRPVSDLENMLTDEISALQS